MSIQTAIGAYCGRLERLSEEQMFDAERQRDMARECIMEIDSIIGVWRNWRQIKPGRKSSSSADS
jgi:hypothetical protein